MIYVERDPEGRIIALHNSKGKNATEKRALTDQEVLEFLEKNEDTDTRVTLLSLSDLGMIRVIDDVVDVLVTKNIIKFTDLPEEAQEKLLNRKQVRSDLNRDSIIMDDDGIL